MADNVLGPKPGIPENQIIDVDNMPLFYISDKRSDDVIDDYQQGQRDMLARCIAAVEAFDHDPLCMGDDIYCCSRNCTIAALRALDGAPHDDPCDCDDCCRWAADELVRDGLTMEHLPECPVVRVYPWPYRLCICTALRACERRVMLHNYERGYGCYGYGYAAGVAAARAAVVSLPDLTPTTAPGWVPRDRALAVIDALAKP